MSAHVLDPVLSIHDHWGVDVAMFSDSEGVSLHFESIYVDEEDLQSILGGIAVSAKCVGEPLHIPSDVDLERNFLSAVEDDAAFVLAIWQRDGTPMPYRNYGNI